MPNIIEQQDLLKGLPDNRLALLMQKPDATIPPFLVAAEAQRRQSIRQQFAGDGSKESVVDTLTKQIANVPQNVQPQMQAPPNIPAPMAPPQAGGIGALPGGQQMAEGGRVEPMWSIPNYSASIPRVGDWIGSTAKSVYDYATTPWGNERSSGPDTTVSDPNMDFNLPDTPIPRTNPNFATTGEPSPYTDLTPKPKKPPNPDTGKQGTSTENKYKAKEAEYRKRIEDLYGTEEPSNWEEAQKWFDMSAQFLNPDNTLMQGIAGAGAAYAGAEAAQSRAQREGDRGLQEALLNYDMQIMQSDRAAEAAAAAKADDRAWELQKGQQLRPSDAIGALGDLIKGIDKKLEDSGMMLDDSAKQSLMRERQMYEMQLANIMKSGGYGASGVITRDQLPQ